MKKVFDNKSGVEGTFILGEFGRNGTRTARSLQAATDKGRKTSTPVATFIDRNDLLNIA